MVYEINGDFKTAFKTNLDKLVAKEDLEPEEDKLLNSVNVATIEEAALSSDPTLDLSDKGSETTAADLVKELECIIPLSMGSTPRPQVR